MTQILPRFYRHQEAANDRATLTRNLLESGDMAPDTLTTAGSTAPGDARKLRGIPAIGRNVAGAIPGTSPHHHRMFR